VRDFLLAGMFIPMILYALPRPWVGVLIWSWLSYMNPHRLCYGFAHDFPFSAITAAVVMIGLVITAAPKHIPWTREVVLLLVFVVWFTFTTVVSLNPNGYSLSHMQGLAVDMAKGAWEGWNRSIKIELMTFVTLMVMRGRKQLDSLVWVIVLSLGFYGMKGGIFAIMTGGTSRVEGPPDTFIGGNNEIALALVMAIPLMRYLQLQTERRWVYFGLLSAQILSVLAVLATYSRAGFLALSMVLLIMALKSRRKVIYSALLAIAIVMLISFMPVEWADRMHTIETYQQDASALGRINAWWFAYNLANDRPFTGGGFNCFTPKLFRTYAPEPNNHHDAHSIYFQLLGEQGYPGLFLFLTLGLLTWRTGSWIVRHARERTSLLWAGDLAAMCQVSLIGYAVGGSFAGLAYFDLPYHIMAIVVLCKALILDEEFEAREEVDVAGQQAPLLQEGVPYAF
jgi:probable O-glycosylation ligase (exosortase A-associated)